MELSQELNEVERKEEILLIREKSDINFEVWNGYLILILNLVLSAAAVGCTILFIYKEAK